MSDKEPVSCSSCRIVLLPTIRVLCGKYLLPAHHGLSSFESLVIFGAAGADAAEAKPVAADLASLESYRCSQSFLESCTNNAANDPFF